MSTDGKLVRPDPNADEADQSGGEHHNRKRDRKGVDGHEGERRDADHRRRPERSFPDPEQGLHHDGKHSCLKPEEQAREPGRVLEQGVGRRECDDDHEPGKHKERPRDQAAAHPMQEPADIGRELLGLWSRQQHAEVQGM
jgi:hypothetical protein